MPPSRTPAACSSWCASCQLQELNQWMDSRSDRAELRQERPEMRPDHRWGKDIAQRPELDLQIVRLLEKLLVFLPKCRRGFRINRSVGDRGRDERRSLREQLLANGREMDGFVGDRPGAIVLDLTGHRQRAQREERQQRQQADAHDEDRHQDLDERDAGLSIRPRWYEMACGGRRHGEPLVDWGEQCRKCLHGNAGHVVAQPGRGGWPHLQRVYHPGMARLALLIIAAALVSPAAVADDRPNIIFIMSDDHAAHAIGAYGSRVNETPHLDRIAREGALLRNVFATNSICTPSRAAILTGQYSHMNGVTVFNRFDSTRQTVARLLQQAGYFTGMIGKWHLGSDPAGFDRWEILPGQGAYNKPVLYTATAEQTYTGRYVTDVITDLAIKFLEERPAAKPFFLMVHHKAPHRPWEPDPAQAARFATRRIPEPPTFFDSYA